MGAAAWLWHPVTQQPSSCASDGGWYTTEAFMPAPPCQHLHARTFAPCSCYSASPERQLRLALQQHVVAELVPVHGAIAVGVHAQEQPAQRCPVIALVRSQQTCRCGSLWLMSLGCALCATSILCDGTRGWQAWLAVGAHSAASVSAAGGWPGDFCFEDGVVAL